MLSEKQKKEYISDGGYHCPYCDSADTEPGESDYPAVNVMEQRITCNDCGSIWTDIFRLTDIRESE